MNIIILQHIKVEDPGFIKDLMLADGFNLTTIELDEGEKIPNDLTKFDGMFCMGGPMDTYMEKQYPWLIEEKWEANDFACCRHNQQLLLLHLSSSMVATIG